MLGLEKNVIELLINGGGGGMGIASDGIEQWNDEF
jgi:hypothetical protein